MKTYLTDNLALAAYLMNQQCVLAGLTSSKTHHGKFLFKFESTKNFHELANAFFSFEASVNPYSYYLNIKELKSLIVKVLRNEENS